MIGNQDPCILVSFKTIKHQLIVRWIINNYWISQESFVDCSQGQVLVRIIDSYQSSLEPINVILNDSPWLLVILKGFFYLSSLLYANRVVPWELLVNTPKEEILPMGSCWNHFRDPCYKLAGNAWQFKTSLLVYKVIWLQKWRMCSNGYVAPK